MLGFVCFLRLRCFFPLVGLKLKGTSNRPCFSGSLDYLVPQSVYLEQTYSQWCSIPSKHRFIVHARCTLVEPSHSSLFVGFRDCLLPRSRFADFHLLLYIAKAWSALATGGVGSHFCDTWILPFQANWTLALSRPFCQCYHSLVSSPTHTRPFDHLVYLFLVPIFSGLRLNPLYFLVLWSK